MTMNLKDYILDVPNWPVKDVVFKDITPLLKNKDALNHSVKLLEDLIDETPDYIVGIESRGFIFGSYLASEMGLGFVPVRKKGKLPPPVISKAYSLEYGFDTLEIKSGKGKVVIVDDVYATGGTAKATRELCEKAGYEVINDIYLINLKFLNNDNVRSVLSYE
jgi:adenine phosphoribosyltransferase